MTAEPEIVKTASTGMWHKVAGMMTDLVRSVVEMVGTASEGFRQFLIMGALVAIYAIVCYVAFERGNDDDDEEIYG